MIGLLALILITNMTNLMSYPTTNTRDGRNNTFCSTSNDVSIATSLIANLMRIFIPFIIMLTLNLLVIFGLKKSKIRVGVSNVMQIAAKSGQQPSRRFTNKEFKFTVSTLIIDFIFLFFYLPLGVAFIIQTYNLFSTSLTSDPIGNAAYGLFNNVSQLFALAHTSVLIFLFIIFNRYFRAELILLLRLHKIFPTLKPESTTNLTRLNNNQSQLF